MVISGRMAKPLGERSCRITARDDNIDVLVPA